MRKCPAESLKWSSPMWKKGWKRSEMILSHDCIMWISFSNIDLVQVYINFLSIAKAYPIVDMTESQLKVGEEDLQKPVNYDILKNYLWAFGGLRHFPTQKDHTVPWPACKIKHIVLQESYRLWSEPLIPYTLLFSDIAWPQVAMLQLCAVFKLYKEVEQVKGWKGLKKETCTANQSSSSVQW